MEPMASFSTLSTSQTTGEPHPVCCDFSLQRHFCRSFRTPLPLRFPPQTLAVAIVYLTFKLRKLLPATARSPSAKPLASSKAGGESKAESKSAIEDGEVVEYAPWHQELYGVSLDTINGS